MKTYDVAVVGRGVIGQSIAYALARADPNLRIALLGKAADRDDASSASGAMLGCFGEITASTLETPAGRARHELGLEALALWPQWLNDLVDSDLFDVDDYIRGTFVLLNAISGRIDDRNFAAIHSAALQAGQPVEHVDACDLSWLNPSTLGRPLQGLYLPDEAAVIAPNWLRALEGALGRREITPQWVTVERIEEDGDGNFSIALDDGSSLSCGNVVIAAGVGSRTLLNGIPSATGRMQPVFAGVGTAIVVRHPRIELQGTVRTPNRSFACGLHTVPRGVGRFYLGATNNILPRPEHEPMLSDLMLLIDGAVGQVDQAFQGAYVEKVVMGSRPVSLDTFPLIGQVGTQRLFVATGTYREGFFLSPCVAEHVAAQVLGGPTAPALAPFDPLRDPIQNFSLDAAIQEAVDHHLALAYERRLQVPQVGGWSESLEKMLHDRVRDVYRRLDLDYIVPPDLLWDIEASDQIAEFRSLIQKYWRTRG